MQNMKIKNTKYNHGSQNMSTSTNGEEEDFFDCDIPEEYAQTLSFKI